MEATMSTSNVISQNARETREFIARWIGRRKNLNHAEYAADLAALKENVHDLVQDNVAPVDNSNLYRQEIQRDARRYITYELHCAALPVMYRHQLYIYVDGYEAGNAAFHRVCGREMGSVNTYKRLFETGGPEEITVYGCGCVKA